MNDFFGQQLSVGDYVVSVGVSGAELKVGVIKNIDFTSKKISVLNCTYGWDMASLKMQWRINSKPGAYTDSKRMLRVDSSTLPGNIVTLFP